MKLKNIHKEYDAEGLKIIWQPAKCIHSENCWRGLPEVFRYGKKPWIDPNAANSGKIIAQIDKCPSGALSYELENNTEHKSSNNSMITISKNGPILVKGETELKMQDGSTKVEKNVALCRCGQSSNKPYCDGTHSKVDFKG